MWLDGLAGGGAVEVGLVGVYGCRWERDEARVGEAVGMSARCVGVADGELALFEVWRETAGADGSCEREKVWGAMGEVNGGRIESAAPFVLAWPKTDGVPSERAVPLATTDAPPPDPLHDEANGRAGTESDLERPPTYIVEVSVGGVHRAHGGALRIQDWIEIEVVDAGDSPLARASYTIELGDGSRVSGTTDSRGVARIDPAPPGVFRIVDVTPRPERKR